MVNWIIGLVVTFVFLVKMLFSDLAGGNDAISSVKDGIKNAKDIADALKED